MARILDENSIEIKTQQEAAKALREELLDRKLTYHIESYGCQMNAHDSERIAGMLRDIGFTGAGDMATANLILFNTCCVREHAEKRVFGNIGALKKRKDEDPGLIIAVCGCMMQQQEVAERLYKRFPFVNLVFGTHSLHELPVLMQRVMQGERPLSCHETDGDVIEGLPALRQAGVSASVNIMYGCNNFCTYCIVPYVRGRERSRRPERIMEEVSMLTQQGYSEITLLGQNVNSYGNDAGDITFPALLQNISMIPGLKRLRFMTSHPKDLSDALIGAIAELPNVCHHVHLPVQSGSDAILRAMNRKYSRANYLRLVEKLRMAATDVELTTDVIVGFPGETEADYLDTLSLIDEVGFAAAFTFMYSPRHGTKAASMAGQISAEDKKARLLRLNSLQEKKTKQNNEKYIGYTGEVLIEGFDDRTIPMVYGKFSNFKMVYFPGTADMIGTYRAVTVEKAQNNSLIGAICNK